MSVVGRGGEALLAGREGGRGGMSRKVEENRAWTDGSNADEREKLGILWEGALQLTYMKTSRTRPFRTRSVINIGGRGHFRECIDFVDNTAFHHVKHPLWPPPWQPSFPSSSSMT